MTAPPVDPETDLTALPYFPVLRRRLFRSQFHLTASDSEWRAGMTLWINSFDQQPAGSLPNDDAQLQRLAGLARQPRKWRRVKQMALHGWEICDDGRLYHQTVADVIERYVLHRSGAKVVQTRSRTRREPPAKSTAASAESNRRESPPISPPPSGGDLFTWDGVKPLGKPVAEDYRLAEAINDLRYARAAAYRQGTLAEWEAANGERLHELQARQRDGNPAPIDPRKVGHSPPCACANCERWAEWQRQQQDQLKTGTG